MARDLVRLSQRGRELVLVELPARGRQLIRHVPEPVQIQLRKLSKRSLRITIEVFAGLLVVGAVALGLAYERLNRGPISMAFLVPSIESAINRELADLEVQIDDAVLQRSPESTGVLFRLRNIRLIDRNGALVAQAPLAAIGLSGSALLWGRVAPGSVDFIGPRLLLFYTPENGLSLTFSPSSPDAARQADALRGVITEGAPSSAGGASNSESRSLDIFSLPSPNAASAGRERQIDLMKTVTSAFERARAGKAASSYLTRFGVRDAVVVFDQDGEQSFWQVPDFAIDLEHRSTRSVLSGEASISSATGPWEFQFRTEQSNKKQRLTFTAMVRDLVPTGLAANFPNLQALQAMNLPVNAETSVELSTSGKLLGAKAKLRIAAGHVTPPWDTKHPMLIDEGELRVRYAADEDRIEVLPSTLQWGESRITVSGEFRPVEAETGPKRWQFRLQANDSVLVGEEFGLPPLKVDQWLAEGTVTPDLGRIDLSRFSIQAGKATLDLAGSVIDAPGSPAVQLHGRIGPMPMAVLLQFWPKFIAGGAREWVGERVTAGYISGGEVKINLPAGLLSDVVEKGAELPDSALSMDVAATGLEIHYIEKMPPIQTADARMTIRGRKFALDVPEGWVTLPSGERIALKEGRLSVDDLRKDPQEGEIVFKSAASATTMMELLDHEPLGYVTALGKKPSDLKGRAEGAFHIKLPMIRTLEFDDVELRGTARVDDPVIESGIDEARIEGGSITFNVSEEALQASGEVLVNGVPAKLSWQRFFDAPEYRQPELRLAFVLNEADRERLGADINHMVRGPVPMVVSIGHGEGGKPSVSMQADLANADLVLSNVGWRKPPGRAATLRYRVVEMADGTTELQDFKIVGDDIAIDGWVAMNANNSPTAFYFNDFSFNLITHIEIAGKLRPDKVWEVRANGTTYDGRQLFQSLFSAGQLADDLRKPEEEGGNLDLSARIGSMVGFFDTTVQDVSITLKKRDGLLRQLSATGNLNGQTPIAIRLDPTPGQPRMLLGESRDAGAAFRLVGFYPRVEGGEASLQVNLDGEGASSKTGVLWARDFVILGDRVVGEVLSNANDDPLQGYREPGRRGGQRQRIVFNQLKVPFSVGGGRFVLHDSYINGPLLGATLRGSVDFGAQQVDLGGTYIPFYGLNSALGSIPIIGNILVGRRGEGVLGITFAIQGPTSDPNVLVNPVSMVAPGIFRQIFEFNGGSTASALPPGEVPARPQPARRRLPPSN